MEKTLMIDGISFNCTIDEYGRVFNLNTGREQRQVNSRGTSKIYKKVKVRYGNGKWKREYIHRLVAEHFIGNPIHPNMVVNHIDGDTFNNHVSNLEWVTKSQNNKHRSPNSRKTKHYKDVYEEGFNVKVKKGNHIHHIDGNHFNDSLDNLIEVTPEQHVWLHLEKNDYLKTYSRDEIKDILKNIPTRIP